MISMKAFRIYIIILLFFTGCKSEDVPVVTTAEVTSITQTSATCGGDVISQGDSEVNTKGICWSITDNPTILDSITVDSFGLGSFTSELTELDPGTEYYVRAYAKNSSGIGYGETKSFTTQPASVPELVTITTLFNITCTTARPGGRIISDGASQIIDRGLCWSKSENPTLSDDFISIGPGSGTFYITITGLESNTTYYVRAYATNSIGTGYGNNTSFTTCLDIHSNPVNPLTMTLYNKPLDTIKKYIQGKWRIVIVRGGIAEINLCVNNFYSEFLKDDKFISNAYLSSPGTDTFRVKWVKESYYQDSTYVMTLYDESWNSVGTSYFIDQIYYDTLIYKDYYVDGLDYYGLQEQ
jgi:hypothetical protein